MAGHQSPLIIDMRRHIFTFRPSCVAEPHPDKPGADQPDQHGEDNEAPGWRMRGLGRDIDNIHAIPARSPPGHPYAQQER